MVSLVFILYFWPFRKGRSSSPTLTDPILTGALSQMNVPTEYGSLLLVFLSPVAPLCMCACKLLLMTQRPMRLGFTAGRRRREGRCRRRSGRGTRYDRIQSTCSCISSRNSFRGGNRCSCYRCCSSRRGTNEDKTEEGERQSEEKT